MPESFVLSRAMACICKAIKRDSFTFRPHAEDNFSLDSKVRSCLNDKGSTKDFGPVAKKRELATMYDE